MLFKFGFCVLILAIAVAARPGDLIIGDPDSQFDEKFAASEPKLFEVSAEDLTVETEHYKVEKLSSVFEKLEAIYANKDQTRAQQEEAINALLKSNQKLIPFTQSTSGGSQSRIRWPTISCTLS